MLQLLTQLSHVSVSLFFSFYLLIILIVNMSVIITFVCQAENSSAG